MRIKKLSDLEKIRKRTAVYFSGKSPLDICNALEQFMRTFLIEVYVGHSKEITLTKRADGSLALKSYDLGLDLGERNDKNANWRKIFCKLCVDWADEGGPFEYTRDELINCYLYDYNCVPSSRAPMHDILNIAAIQLASSFMDVEVNRDGKLKKLRFEHGKNVKRLSVEPSVDFRSYTLLKFSFDPELFETTEVPHEYIVRLFARYSYLLPNAVFEYVDEKSQKTSVFNFKKRNDYLSYLSDSKCGTVYSNESIAHASERYDRTPYDAKVRVRVAIAKDAGKVECIHNYKLLEERGTHFEMIKENVCRWISHVFADMLPEGNLKNEFWVKWEDLSDHLVIVLESYCPAYSTQWITTSHVSIKNRVITDMCEDLISNYHQFDEHPFAMFLNENRGAVAEIIKDILSKRGS